MSIFNYLRHQLAVALIRAGFALLDPAVHEMVVKMIGIAGRKGII